MTGQPEQSTPTTCPRCGEVSTGRFCSGCGAPLRDVSCETCGHALVAGARFCNNCGSPVSVVSPSGAKAQSPRSDSRLAQQIAVAAVVAFIGFVGGEYVGRRSVAPDLTVAQQADGGGATPLATPGAPDISQMSPEERASRLFNRVMAYSEQGKMDSARFFAPMAIQSYLMIGPLDAHARYDIGAIAAAVGDVSVARAQADTILSAQPNHLLGLALAARAADQQGDAAAATKFRRRLVAAATAERAKGLKEYTEHARDIDDALKKAGASP